MNDARDPSGDDGSADILAELRAEQNLVRPALDQIAQGLDGHGCAAELVENARIVLAEVLNNIVEHAFVGTEPGTIRVAIWTGRTKFACDIWDDGIPLPDTTLADRGFPAAAADQIESWPEGGFGWAMVQHMTDRIDYARDGAENRLQLWMSVQNH